MGFDLRNEKGDTFHYNMSGWVNMLYMAQEYGWEPLGTKPPDDFEDHDGIAWDEMNYGSNDHQTVTAEDALNLATALEKALPMIEDADLGSPAYLYHYAPEYSSTNLPHLERFIAFCREGGFTIG